MQEATFRKPQGNRQSWPQQSSYVRDSHINEMPCAYVFTRDTHFTECFEAQFSKDTTPPLQWLQSLVNAETQSHQRACWPHTHRDLGHTHGSLLMYIRYTQAATPPPRHGGWCYYCSM